MYFKGFFTRFSLILLLSCQEAVGYSVAHVDPCFFHAHTEDTVSANCIFIPKGMIKLMIYLLWALQLYGFFLLSVVFQEQAAVIYG